MFRLTWSAITHVVNHVAVLAVLHLAVQEALQAAVLRQTLQLQRIVAVDLRLRERGYDTGVRMGLLVVVRMVATDLRMSG